MNREIVVASLDGVAFASRRISAEQEKRDGTEVIASPRDRERERERERERRGGAVSLAGSRYIYQSFLLPLAACSTTVSLV